MGSNKTQSDSAPVSAEDRLNAYNAATLDSYKDAKDGTIKQGARLNNIIPRGSYQKADYTDSGSAQRLSGGDYNRLEDSILASRLAPLRQYEVEQRAAADADLNRRGIYTSGIASRVQGNITDKLADNYQQAGADATTQRYNLEAQDLNSTNQFNLNRASMANQFNSTEQDRVYQSKWRPADYLAGIWNGTGGVVSSSSGGGWSI